MVHRVVGDIGVEVDAAALSDGVGLHEPSDARVIDAVAVMVEADFGDPHLAGIAEPGGVAAAGHAIFIIGVDLHGRA